VTRLALVALVAAAPGLSCSGGTRAVGDVRSGPDAPLIGLWEGGAVANGDTLPMRFRLTDGPDGLAGTLDLPTVGVLRWPMSTVDTVGGRLTLEFPSDNGVNRLVAERSGTELVGTVTMVGVAEAHVRLRPPSSLLDLPIQEEVTFESDGVRLAGRVTLPAAAGPHSAIVFAHGSGDVTRDSYTFMAARYADIGVATLAFDKRGAGESEGSWREVGFDVLAADVLAGVAFMAARDDIATDRIGLSGQSQGGWIAPLAASLSDAVAFVITISGPLVSPAREGHWDAIWGLTQAGYGRAEIDRAVEVLELVDDAIRAGQGWEAVQAATDVVSGEAWFEYADIPRHWDAGRDYSWYRRIMDFDPVPVFERLEVPVLAVLAERDESIPALESAEILGALADGGNKPFTVRVFPDADHGMRVGPTDERFRWPAYVPGYLDLLSTWVTEQTSVGG